VDVAGSAGALWVQVKPSLEGFGNDLRRQIEASVPPEIRVRIRPDDDPATSGAQYAGKFADALKARMAAALRDLPKAEITADSSDADRKLADLRARLDELNGKTIGVDISAADAKAELDTIKASLDELARKSPDVRVRVDAGAAAAEIAAFDAEVDKLDGKVASPKVDTSSAQRDLGLLMSAGLSLGPALIPIGASVAAALLSIGPAALAGAGAIAAVGLAFKGIGSAISAYDTQQKQSASTAGSSANAQRQAAFSIASAQDGVKSAVIGVATAQENAASSIKSALNSQVSAEEALTNAQKTQQQAQQNLTQARKDAAATLQSLAFGVQDNALSQRGARLQLQQAQQSQSQLGPGSTQLQRDQAQLAVDQARQQITELAAAGKDLAGQKADADRKGIEGSTQVTAAQNAITQAVQRTNDAKRALGAANDAVDKAEVDGVRQIAQAQQGVIAAQRGLEQAQMSAASSTSTASTATNAYADAMKKLSPAGQDFVRFYQGTLKPRLDDLGKVAQVGLLPGLQSGIMAATPALDQLKTFIGNISGELGKLANEAGHALAGPVWHSFFDFMNTTAGPSIDKVAHAIGNFLTGAAGIMQALYQPVFVPIMDWIVKLSAKVAEFGGSAAAGTNSGFNKFIKYVQDNGPVVKQLLGDVAVIVGHLVEGLAAQGGDTLPLLTKAMDALASLSPSTLAVLVEAFAAWKVAQSAIEGAKGAIDSVKSAKESFDSAKRMWDSVKDIRWSDVTGKLQDVWTRLSNIRGLGGLVGVLGVAAAIAGLELLSTQLDTLNVDWQKGPDGKPTTAAQKTTGQGFTNAAVTSLHTAANGSEGTQIVDAVSKGDFSSHETFDFANSPVAHAFRDIGTQWNKDVANIPNSPAGKFITDTKDQWNKDVANIPNSPIGKAIGSVRDQWNTDVANLPNSPGGKIWSTVSGWASQTATDVGKSAQDTWSSVSGWFGRTTTDVSKSASDAWSSVSGWWGRTTSDVGKSASDAWSSVSGWFGRTTTDVSKSASDAWSNVSGWFGRTTTDVSKSASDAWSSVSGWFGRTAGDVGKSASDAWSGATGWFGRMRDDVTGAVSDLWRGVTGWVGRLGVDLGKAWDGIVSYATRAWAGIKAAAAVPVNFLVQTVYGGGIVPAWNAVASLVGLGPLPPPGDPIHFAEGGAVPGNIPGATPGRDSVRAMLMPGEFVVPTAMVPALGGHGVLEAIRQSVVGTGPRPMTSGLPAYGLGGIIGDIWGNVTDGAQAVGSWVAGKAGAISSFVTDAITNASNAVHGLFSGVGDQLGQFASSGIGRDAIAFPGKVTDVVTTKVADAVKGLMSFGGSGGGGAGVAQWRPAVAAALGMLGQPATLADDTLRRMNQESGGNPTIVNRWDSNWVRGTPSVGLMQVIGPTYRANADKRHDVGPYLYGTSVDPLSNILASMHYTLGRYGSLPAGYDRAGGYDQGGWLMPGRTAALNLTGHPEAVLNPTDSAAFRHVARAAAAGRLGANGRGATHNWTVYAQDMDPGRLAVEVERRTEFAHRIGGTS
jgi:SLT domain-containing protein